jgi:SHS2 domain-containing protein
MSRPANGHEEIPHTADWALRVWAADLPSLFGEAAIGMASLSGVRLEAGARMPRTVELEAPDHEGLLVAFLSELLYIQEQERLGFDRLSVQLYGAHLKAQLDVAPLAGLAKPIKAVTFHNLKILHTAKGYEVEIVFDV